MKNIILLTAIIFTSSVCFAQSWGGGGEKKDGWLFNSDNKTQVIVNEDSAKSEAKNGGGLSGKESTYNIDLEGMAYVMPDQPASDQTLTTFTGFGTTYKFSDKMQIVGKWMRFEIKGVSEVTWKHDHKLIGVGIRDKFGDSQLIQANILTGESTVEGDQGIGTVNNLELPVFLDIKYTWMFGESFIIGPQITFGRVANTCEDPDGKYTECGHGGYTSIGLTLQIGIPDDMVSE